MDKLTILLILAGVIVAELIVLNIFLFMAIGKIKECAQNTDEQRSAVLKMVAMNSKTGMMGEQAVQNVDAMKMHAPSQIPGQPVGNVNNQPVQSMSNMNNQQVQPVGNMNNQPVQMPKQVNGQPESFKEEKSVNIMQNAFDPEATTVLSKVVANQNEKAEQSEAKAMSKQGADNDEGTIICSNCYSPLPAYGKFCPNCSAPIEGR